MHNTGILKLTVALLIAVVVQNTAQAQVTRRDEGNARIVNRLQGMVRSITAERDVLKAENEKLAAEIEILKREKDTVVSAQERLSSELDVQKTAAEAVRSRLDTVHAKLQEIVGKFNTLNQAKHRLDQAHTELQSLQAFTRAELLVCEDKNIKMYQATREILDTYQDRNQSFWSRLIEVEPILRFNSVEVENIIQEYEDKLISQKYQGKTESFLPPSSPLSRTPEEIE